MAPRKVDGSRQEGAVQRTPRNKQEEMPDHRGYNECVRAHSSREPVDSTTTQDAEKGALLVLHLRINHVFADRTFHMSYGLQGQQQPNVNSCHGALK